MITPGKSVSVSVAALDRSRTHLIFDASIDTGVDVDYGTLCECCN